MLRKPTIVVVSHERSGTHYLINSIAKNFGYSYKADSILGSPLMLLDRIMKHEGKEMIIKSHHQYQFLAPVIEDIKKIAKIVYIRRDGRDVLASCYYYMKKHAKIGCFPKTESFSSFIREAPYKYTFDGNYTVEKSSNMAARGARHIKGGLHKAPCIRFEDMKN